jgi:hypothetical protein
LGYRELSWSTLKYLGLSPQYPSILLCKTTMFFEKNKFFGNKTA